MKRQIRRMVFETNSSSTHSLTMCSKEDYDKWQKGELLLDDNYRSKGQFITKEAAIQKLKDNNCDIDFNNDDELTSELRDYECYMYNSYWSDDLEDFESTYTTKSGEQIVAFGQYGSDN